MIKSFKNRVNYFFRNYAISQLVTQNLIPDPKVSLLRLKELGFMPGVVYDVGAYEGSFSEMIFSIWPESSIVAFEVLPDKINRLKTKFVNYKFQLVDKIVGNENKKEVLFYANETASSVLQSEEVYATKSHLSKEMITLDSFIDKNKKLTPNFLKLDTQGFEYYILKGAENSLENIDLILVELNFLEVYQNAKMAPYVINFLSSYNFMLYDIYEIHRRPLDNALFQIDVIFVKADSFLRSDKRWDIKRV